MKDCISEHLQSQQNTKKPTVPSTNRFSEAMQKHYYRRHGCFLAATKDNYNPFREAICDLFRKLQKTFVPSSAKYFGHGVDSKKLCFFHSIWKQFSRAVKFYKNHSAAIRNCVSEACFSEFSKVYRDEMHSNKMVDRNFFKISSSIFSKFCEFAST